MESPTATFQLTDFSMANIVSAAIFGDGAATILLSSCPEDEGPSIIAGEMYHFYNAEQMMGFKVTDTGLQMILDETVPKQLQNIFQKSFTLFLRGIIPA